MGTGLANWREYATPAYATAIESAARIICRARLAVLRTSVNR
jgi:hypothetical protein